MVGVQRAIHPTKECKVGSNRTTLFCVFGVQRAIHPTKECAIGSNRTTLFFDGGGPPSHPSNIGMPNWKQPNYTVLCGGGPTSHPSNKGLQKWKQSNYTRCRKKLKKTRKPLKKTYSFSNRFASEHKKTVPGLGARGGGPTSKASM